MSLSYYYYFYLSLSESLKIMEYQNFTFKCIAIPSRVYETLALGIGCYMALDTQINAISLDTFACIPSH